MNELFQRFLQDLIYVDALISAHPALLLVLIPLIIMIPTFLDYLSEFMKNFAIGFLGILTVLGYAGLWLLAGLFSLIVAWKERNHEKR